MIQLQMLIDTKQVSTVQGSVSSSALGRVLMHEHLFCRVRSCHLDAAFSYLSSQFEVLKKHGVSTIVDLTTYVLPDKYLPLIHKYDINVICCTGFYLRKYVPKSYYQLDAEQLAAKLQNKIIYGIGHNRVKPGIIKVASNGLHLNKFEKNVFRAAAIVHRQYGLPIATHACRGGRKQLEFLLEQDVNPRKVFLSHVEMGLKGRDAQSYEDLLSDILWMLDQGAYLFFGDFPVNTSPYKRSILKILQTCVSQGFGNQIFLSTDSFWSFNKGKIAVRGSSTDARFPRTYEYTFSLIIPFLLENGFSENDISTFLEKNPSLFFS